MLCRRAERFDEARELLVEAARTWKTSDPSRYASAVAELANVLLRTGQLDEAETLYRTALPVFEARGDQAHVANARSALGQVAYVQGQRRAAAAALRAAIASLEGAGQARYRAVMLANLGSVCIDLGEGAEAASLLAQAERLHAHHERPASAQRVRAALATLRFLRGDLDGAREALDELLPSLGLGARTVSFHLTRAWLAQLDGASPTPWLTPLLDRLKGHQERAEVLCAAAHLSLMRGELPAALDAWERVELLATTDELRAELHTGRAGVALAQGEPAEADEQLARAEALTSPDTPVVMRARRLGLRSRIAAEQGERYVVTESMAGLDALVERLGEVGRSPLRGLVR